MMSREPLRIAESSVPPGREMRLEIPIAQLMSGTPVALPLRVLHGKTEGATVWLSGAIHGDELSGVEIIRQVLAELDPTAMCGTVIACPIVNVHGFNMGTRYLPDRRDLNRSFPGSARGSLAARIAHLFMIEVVGRCEVGIDFHTGSDHRRNIPQIRADLDDPRTMELAGVFAAPLALHAKVRDGSLRHAATESGATVLVFEGGEAHRFDSESIAAGRDGTLRILAELGVISEAPTSTHQTALSRESRWMRAARSGILNIETDLGAAVEAGSTIATIIDPFGRRLSRVKSRVSGVVIGLRQHPLVNQGDAVAHVAEI